LLAASELAVRHVQGAHAQQALLVPSACSLFACRTVLGKDQPGARGKEELRQSTYTVIDGKVRGKFEFSALQLLLTDSRLNFAFTEIAAKLLMSVENHLLISDLN